LAKCLSINIAKDLPRQSRVRLMNQIVFGDGRPQQRIANLDLQQLDRFRHFTKFLINI
jgi:hypothetical protein